LLHLVLPDQNACAMFARDASCWRIQRRPRSPCAPLPSFAVLLRRTLVSSADTPVHGTLALTEGRLVRLIPRISPSKAASQPATVPLVVPPEGTDPFS
jgi:hypothetical protein